MERIAPGWKALGVAGAAVTVLAQTKPEEAISNIAAWAKLVGREHMPSFLMTPRIDLVATVLGLGVLVLALVMWRRQVVHVHHKELTAQSHVTTSVGMVVHRAPQRQLVAWIPLWEALRYLVYDTQWAEAQPAPKDEKDFDDRVSVELREHLARGDIAARGKAGWGDDNSKCATEPIAAEFWINAYIQPHGEIVLANDDRCAATEKGGKICYQRIILARDQVEQIWSQRDSLNKGLTVLAQFVEPLRAKIEAEKSNA